MKLIASNQLTVTNLLERAETRRETFYKLTNSADIPEVPSDNRNLLLYSADPWQAPQTGYYQFFGTAKTSETYDGAVVYKTGGAWNRLGINLNNHLVERGLLKAGDVLTYSVLAKTDQETPIQSRLFVRYNNQSGTESISGKAEIINLTNEWQKVSVTFTVTEKMLSEEHRVNYLGWEQTTNSESGKYVYYTCNKIERGNVATPYSQAPEDLWSTATLVPTQQQRYLWKFEYIYYSDGSVEVTQPVNLSIAGADADTTGVTDAINQTNQTVASLQNSVSQAQSDLATVSSNLTQARQDLESSIASVNTKAQAVETTLAQVQSTANANSQKTATLENDLNGLSAKFSSLKIGGTNLLLYSADPWQAPSGYYQGNGATRTDETYNGSVVYRARSIWNGLRINLGNLADRGLLKVGDVLTYSIAMRAEQETPIQARLFVRYTNESGAVSPTGKPEIVNLSTDWQCFSVTFTVSAKMLAENTKVTYLGWELTSNAESDKYVYFACNKIERGNIATDYSPNEADIEQKVANYKQTADQNYASLQTTVQNLDSTVQQNKTVADQTAAGFKTRIESLETYKDGETTRANQYFESAKTETARQLTAERTAIANDYVAKSTYTSDVTGLRNDLTATTTTANTTKTNLASYQASNDQAVANLQSSLQTTNGNVSSLQTQVAAVPGQITSAVSAVEGKIPTSVGGRNLLVKTNQGKTNWKWPMATGGGDVTIESIDIDGVSAVKMTKGNGTASSGWNMITYSGLLRNLIESNTQYTLSFDVKPNVNAYFTAALMQSDAQNRLTNSVGMGTALADVWTRISCVLTSVATLPESVVSQVVYLGGMPTINGSTVIFKNIKLEKGVVSSDWTPAPEDTANQISTLSSQIQQTADGMTLLATKTELNSAKTELQSGIATATSKADNAQSTANSNADIISTHTTQISVLNTGLSTKVSQSDFNTLSGRVSTAENNITAKANELRSEISVVEGKIPTSVGGRNYLRGTSDKYQTYTNSNYILGYPSTYRDWGKLLDPLRGKTVTIRAYIKNDTDYPVRIQIWFTAGGIYGNTVAPHSEGWSVKTGKMSADWTSANVALTQEPSTATGGTIHVKEAKLEIGNVPSDWTPAPEDYDSALATAKSEIKQTTDSITASVSSVETKADNAQTTANSAVSKANAAQTAVNTLDSEVVKSASLNLDNNGFVTKVGKTIDGNKFATMIAQDANNVKIIADEMQVTANMIVDGAVTANKLSVNNLSAVNSNLGAIKGGSLLLQENKTASSSVDNWGTFNRPAHKQGLYMDNHGLASSGAIQRKNGSETTPTDMPLAVLQSGELRFLVVDYNDNLENVLHYGLSDPDYGAIRFEIDSELKRRLTMTSSGYLNFQATNYTNWQSTGVSGCEYMIQGRLVLVNYDVTFNSAGTHTIGSVPQEFVRKSLMLTAKGWSVIPRDKNAQLNPDGSLHILDAEANVNYRGTLVFSY